MKIIFLSFIFLFLSGDFNRIAEINRLKKEAANEYLQKHYKEAAAKYRILIDSLGENDDQLMMNLSHCYFHLKDTTNAFSSYKKLTQSSDKKYQSTAWQQLGILDTESRHLADAEEDFKNALRADPSNDGARYNYELLKKKFRNQEQKNQNQKNDQNKQQNKNDQNQKNQNQQQQQQQNKQQQQQQQQNKQGDQNKQQKQEGQQQKQQQQQQGQQDKKNQEQQKQQQAQQPGDQQKNDQDKSPMMNDDQFKENKISQAKARMILDAMKNTEEQYLQQLKRKATKTPESGKPDW